MRWSHRVLGLLPAILPAVSCSDSEGSSAADPCTGVLCSGHGTCVAIGDAPSCSCEAGFAASDHDCVDVDECATDNGGCDPLTTCTNAVGTYSCGACPSGYAGTGASGCLDIDECATGNGGCDQTCLDEPAGSYTCSCSLGYALGVDGHTCEPIDPCATGNGGCDQTCTYVGPGEADCACGAGFLLDADGHTCVVDICARLCGDTERCEDGAIALDNDCDGEVDEGCACAHGQAQGCFRGDPSYSTAPGCFAGVQVCTEAGTWGACEGGVHATSSCYLDEQTSCHALSGLPFVPVDLVAGTGNFSADALSETFTVGCPPNVAFCPPVTGAGPADDFTPLQSGEYTVTYTKTTTGGDASCVFGLFVGATGLRVELDWEHDLGGTGVDLDLHLHKPADTGVWGADSGTPVDCAWDNCTVSDFNPSSPDPNAPDWFVGTAPPEPVDWYVDLTPEKNSCYYGPRGQGLAWQAYASGCHNPRLDVDNVSCDPTILDPTSNAFCTPENSNIDFPPLDQWTRVAVDYYDARGQAYNVHPRVTIFCDGQPAALLGPSGFYTPESAVTFSPADATSQRFWLVADVVFVSDGCGGRRCVVQPLYADPGVQTPLLTTVPAAQATFGPPYPPLP